MASEMYRHGLNKQLEQFYKIRRYPACLNGSNLLKIKMKYGKKYKQNDSKELYKSIFNE